MSLPPEVNCLPLAPFDLPYVDESAAWAALLRWTPQLVAWPTSPNEPAWHLAAAGFPGLGANAQVEQAGFDAALEAHQLAFLRYDTDYAVVPAVTRLTERLPWRIGERPSMQAVVVGVYGPLSLGLTLVDDNNRPIIADAQLQESLLQHLSLRMGWLEAQLATAVVCLIEPFWSATRSPFVVHSPANVLELVLEATTMLQTAVGLAPSGAVDWPPILRSRLQFVVCQPDQRAAILGCGSCLNDFFERGGVVAWAVVPSDPVELAATSVNAVCNDWDAMLKLALEQNVLNSRLLSGSILTITAGLRQHLPAVADQALTMLADVSRTLRARYKLT